MDINTLIDTAAVALAEDSQLQDWADTNYERPVTVFVNIDERDPPGEDQMPCVVIVPAEKTVGYGRSEKSHRIIVVAWLIDETRQELAEGRIVKFAGAARIETMRKRIENVIADLDLGDADPLLEQILIEYDTVTQFPLFEAAMTITLTESVTLGSNYLE